MPRLSKIGAAALAAFGWTSGASAVTATYLQVAGGGGGGCVVGGGGGGGGLLTGTTSLSLTQSYTILVGAGGVGGVYSSVYNYGTSGSNSQIGSLTASVGGGAGGPGNGNVGLDGGSGGGGGASSSYAGNGGAGTSGQGYAGGNSQVGNGSTTQGSGGGGGAGAAGANATNASAGNGGVGVASSISGTSTYYAGGGGGGHRSSSFPAGTGGNGGGANGNQGQSNAAAGSQSTGGGGGGAGYDNAGNLYSGGNGGSGIVIISYAGAQQFGGGIVTSVGGNTIHTFTTSGTLSPLSSLSADYLIVAGGGGGGYNSGGGGGAGGIVTSTAVTIDTNSNYVVTVGAGGTASNGGSAGTNGGTSSFSIVATSANGGGLGGSFGSYSSNGNSGGSGGGGSGAPGTGGSATQGFAGGNGTSGAAGGGGGNSAVGATGGSIGGNGGAGTASSYSGSSVTYAGGGGGGSNGGSYSSGANGGGNGGYTGGVAGTAATANTGSGGGGGGQGGGAGGNGGSGIVIIRYAGSTQQMAGGTVTITGGYVIHTFTNSGYLAPLKLVNNSLRFRASNSAYLSRTPKTQGNRQIWTWSAWVKLGNMATSTTNMFGATNSASSNNDNVAFYQNKLDFYIAAAAAEIRSTAVYRDPAAWYHVVAAVDTTQATASNRVKLYMNGSQVTVFDTVTYPAQNTNCYVNDIYEHDLGRYVSGGYWDGYMAEVNFIDGQQLTPNAFGTFNSYGVWQPITYGGSYGTNGFYLNFSNNNSLTTIGSDSSPNGNNWTANNISLARSYTTYTSSSGTYTVPAGITSIQYLVVGGGGGGGGGNLDGGGGAGGVLTGTMTVTPGQTISYSIGAGGASGTKGSNTTFGSLTAYGGGTGTRSASGGSQNGGSGGGAYYYSIPTPGTGVAGQGNSGGYGFPDESAGGGGGAGGAGYPAQGGQGGNGGPGIQWINGSYYGGGGGGGAFSGTGGSGGVGGGGKANNGNASGSAGTANTGGGGGGASYAPPGGSVGGAGGSGIIIIATGSASTYDSMTDAPTLTSATAANYAVLNPLSKGSDVSITNGNLTYALTGSTNCNMYSSIGMTSGKFYCEVSITGNQYSLVGISDANVPAGNGFYQQSAGYGYYGSNGNKYNSGSGTGYGSTFTAGDVIGIAFDATNGTLIFYKNGVSQGTAYSSIPAGTYFFCEGNVSNLPQGSFNFGQQPFVYTPPSGYVALNTYNL